MLRRTLCLDAEGGEGGGEGDKGPMITVKIGDQEHKIPKPAGLFTKEDLESKYIPKGAHNAEMAKMRKQIEGYANFKNPDDLLSDDEFRNKATEKWGLSPNQTAEQLKEQVRKAREEITEREIKPRETKLANLATRVTKLQARDLEAQITQAAAGLVKPEFLKSPAKGKPAIIVSLLRDAFGYDDEHESWFARNANGFVYSQGGEQPYQTPAEFLQAWIDGDGKEFAKQQKQSGADADKGGDGSGGGSGQVGKEIRLTREQIRDIPYFKKMQEKADREGLTIVPIG